MIRSAPFAPTSLVLALAAALALAALLSGCPGAAPPPPSGPRFTVVLTEVGDDQAAVVAAVASIRGSHPKLAQKIVERIGVAGGSLPIAVDVDQATADRAAAALRQAGAQAVVQPRS